MTEYEGAFWDQRYQAPGYLFGEEPSQWLRSVAWRFPLQAPGRVRVLTAGDGEGRNGVWLAGLGLNVASFDGSAEAVTKARSLAARRGVALDARHATIDDFPWADAGWDVVVSIFVHVPAPERPAYLARLVRAVAPGGLLVFEAFHRRQRERGRTSGGSPDIDRLYDLDTVADAFQALTSLEILEGTVCLDEGPGHQGPGEVVRYLGRKPG